jgi:hypothetical protein
MQGDALLGVLAESVAPAHPGPVTHVRRGLGPEKPASATRNVDDYSNRKYDSCRTCERFHDSSFPSQFECDGERCQSARDLLLTHAENGAKSDHGEAICATRAH